MDPKRIVEDGFDLIAERYAEWASRTRTQERARYVDVMLGSLQPGARVLDLGCGCAGWVTRKLASRFRVTGIDLSARSVEIARRHAPRADFIHGDMMRIDLPPGRFDAVAAFYSVVHLPRAEHASLFAKVRSWLRLGGLLVATLGAVDDEVGSDSDWLGVPMFWSGYDAATGRRLVEKAGLVVDHASVETADEDGDAVSFHWVVAPRPESGIVREEPV
jgi:cyclopropane fatty-acyl-phospholipid synthase-like methyltransferase